MSTAKKNRTKAEAWHAQVQRAVARDFAANELKTAFTRGFEEGSFERSPYEKGAPMHHAWVWGNQLRRTLDRKGK